MMELEEPTGLAFDDDLDRFDDDDDVDDGTLMGSGVESADTNSASHSTSESSSCARL